MLKIERLLPSIDISFTKTALKIFEILFRNREIPFLKELKTITRKRNI